MRRSSLKWLMLAAIVLALLVVVISIFVRPQKKVDDPLPTQTVQLLPFATLTPSPSPSPAPTGTAQSGFVQFPTGTATSGYSAPTATPTIRVITASPTPKPALTYTPTQKPAPTDDGTLRNGSEGQKVRTLQQRLKELGYYTGSVDGSFGDGTEAALRAFQTRNGLTADGIAGQKTLNQLDSSSAKSASASSASTPSNSYATSRPTPKTYTPSTPNQYRYLQEGSSGADVTRLQNRLRDLGYYNGACNGSFGVDTKAAVTAFQQRNGLWVDGVAGEDTQLMLFSSQALPLGRAPVATQVAYRTLKNGMQGEDIKQLQIRLAELYFYSSTYDGKFGDSTELAVKEFQRVNGLTADGVAGSGTQSRLFASNAKSAAAPVASATPFKAGGTLQLGSMGDEVYRLQERLYDLGYYTGRIDGIYSDAVASAVRAFQTANGLTADGKAGANTQMRLFSTSAVKAASTTNIYATLREGDQGERVRALQTLLAQYGYFSATVDGNFGDSTVTAVQMLQANNGLNPDGVAGPATLQLLYNGAPKRAQSGTSGGNQSSTFTTLRQGDTGADVMQMQQYLLDLGYYAGILDGNFGATTFIAVQAFQQRNNLTADGIAGQATLALLYSGDGMPAANIYGTLPQSAETRATLKSGDEGQDVFNLQVQLKTLGYFTAEPDGKFGSATVSAVKAFQSRNSLASDGVAGQTTLTQAYSVSVVPASAQAQTGPMASLSNSARELEEQKATGSIQGSLAGGGIAASLNSTVYYAGGDNGTLYSSSGGQARQIFDGPASYIHATEKGVTFVSGSQIMRVPTGGGAPQTLISAGGIRKLSMVGEAMYYLEGGSLVRAYNAETATVLASELNDFAVDIFDQTVYTASASGVYRIALNGGSEEKLVSTAADQVQLCDSVVFFRSGGAIYRIENGISALLLEDDISWMGIYREKLYYISGDRLYRCDTNGQNNRVFYDGLTAEVSFVSGTVYIARDTGGPVVEKLSAEG